MMMVVLEGTEPPTCGRHCSEWARVYMSYCLCNFRDVLSLSVGLISVLSWAIAEIPQILTNYKQKSAQGLSISFLITWIIGDLFNLFGCILEPATLPAQFYMAVLYTLTTMILGGQTIYYGYIYNRRKWKNLFQKGDVPKQIEDTENIQGNVDGGAKQANNVERQRNEHGAGRGNPLSSPIPFSASPQINSPGRELYYVSARSLSSSRTPTAGSLLAQKMTFNSFHTMEEPLLSGAVSIQSSPTLNTKTMLSMVSVFTFLGTLNLHQLPGKRSNVMVGNANQGFVMQAGQQLSQINRFVGENYNGGSSGIGTFFGWAMAIIYMSGRLPQICLNIKRGHVEGLNPLMFLFALIGNSTYVGSILINSLEWSKIKPNIPWLVDAGGCVLLDAFILVQFVYFRYRIRQVSGFKQQNP